MIGLHKAASGAAAALVLGIGWTCGLTARAAETQQSASAAKMISVSFATSDLDRSVAFYTKVIGLTETRTIENPTQKKIRLDFPGGGAGLLLIKDKGAQPGSVGSHIGRINLEAPDLRAIETRLLAAGYKWQMAIFESPQYRVLTAVAVDPDGNELEIIQRLP